MTSLETDDLLRPGAPIGRRRVLTGAGALALATALEGTRAGAAAPEPTAPIPVVKGRGSFEPATLETIVTRASALSRLRSLAIAHQGEVQVARAVRGPDLDTPTNVKSVSKSVMAALLGIAIDRGVIAGVDQPIAPLLGDLVPADADPRVRSITIDHLLTMRAGLERTSGRNYGDWVRSPNWVEDALSRPFVAEPGGRMLYSTGSYHVLSVLLTRITGTSTLTLARSWLGEPLDIAIPPWTLDPQGFYLGGNNMRLSPRAMLRFGEMYRRRGQFRERRIVPAAWVDASWTPRTRSPFTGHSYGYGWFMATAQGQTVVYAWGYGGQMIYIVPSLELTVVITSDASSPGGRGGYIDELHRLVAFDIMPALRAAPSDPSPQPS